MDRVERNPKLYSITIYIFLLSLPGFSNTLTLFSIHFTCSQIVFVGKRFRGFFGKQKKNFIPYFWVVVVHRLTPLSVGISKATFVGLRSCLFRKRFARYFVTPSLNVKIHLIIFYQ